MITGLFPSAARPILPAEADPAPGEKDQSAVGDRDAMGIATEIIEHLLGSAERSLGVDEERENRSLQRKGRGPSGANRLTIPEAW